MDPVSAQTASSLARPSQPRRTGPAAARRPYADARPVAQESVYASGVASGERTTLPGVAHFLRSTDRTASDPSDQAPSGHSAGAAAAGRGHLRTEPLRPGYRLFQAS